MAILYSAQDARRFLEEQPEAGAIVALTPEARAALKGGRTPPVFSDAISSRAHARICARARRSAREVSQELLNSEIRLSIRNWIHVTVRNHSHITARAWEVLLGDGPWLLCHGAGWELFEDRKAAHLALIDHLKISHRVQRLEPPFIPLFRYLRMMVAILLRRSGPWCATPRIGLVFGLNKLLRECTPSTRPLALEIANRGVSEYLNLFQTLFAGIAGVPGARLTLVGMPREWHRQAVSAALASITDPVVRRGLRPRDVEDLCQGAAYFEGLFEDAVALLAKLKLGSFVSRQNSGSFGVIAEAAGAAGVPRYVINYNSLVPSESAVADELSRYYFHVRMPLGLSDNYLLWSPQIAALSRKVYGDGNKARIRPLRLAPAGYSRTAKPVECRRILFASNYIDWHIFLPWILETSNEFIDDILAVVECTSDMENVELTIRTKAKGECNPETIRRLLPPAAKCKVTGTKVPFETAVAECDVMIAFNSTTIEEAILQRKPVLLWGPVGRYEHLESRRIPPTANSRSAVYSARTTRQLKQMIPAILDAHCESPLTDEEIEPYVWPEGTLGLRQLAQLICEAQPVP